MSTSPEGTAERKKFRFGLLPRILLAIVLGIVCARFFPVELARVFITFNGIFSNFLGFIIPVLIVALVTPAIAELGRGAGKWLGITAGIAYLSTIVAGAIAAVLAYALLPMLLGNRTLSAVANPEDAFLTPFFEIEMAPPFEIMTALLLSFVIGVGLTLVTGHTLQEAFVDLRDIIVRTIEAIIIPLLPLYIFGMFLNLAMNGQVWEIISSLLLVIVEVFALTVAWLVALFCIAGLIWGRNPFMMMKAMLPAYFTALGTSSSAATIPVTLRCAKSFGVPDSVASFTIPLCATIHLSGSMLKITTFSIAIILMTHMNVALPQMIGFILMLGITMVAAPGVPGGAIMAAIGILESMLGFDKTAQGLMIAMYIAVDSFGTATNVTGDGAIAAIVAKLSDGKIDATPAPEGSLSDEALDRAYPAADHSDVAPERRHDLG